MTGRPTNGGSPGPKGEADWDTPSAQENMEYLLAEVRAGRPQLIRDAGELDVRVSLSDGGPDAPEPLGLSYLLTGRANAEALEQAIQQWYESRYPDPTKTSPAMRHLPPNLAGDVALWIKREQGTMALAMHVLVYVIALRNAQDVLELPRSTASAVAAGLDLTTSGILIDAQTAQELTHLVWSIDWGEDAAETVVGDDWGHISRRGDGPKPVT
ncbi:hypothetical protein L1785_18735 [Antribacter sp. KLBMP9083]|uniref:Uncharacterized protein n=1 Tax=Antribacter soli TaxID=2910976 RepID=A0AA41U8R9_9MICO|nr:hypothetical protein [Antribacter soli]MCF4123016.1 hypothetical protein [Antribacter soli]